MPKELIDRYSEFLARAHETIMRFVAGVAVPDNVHSRVAMAYAGSILEFTNAFSDLLKAHHVSSAQVILRSILEGYVDLRCMLTDPIYIESRDLSHHEEWLAVLEAAKVGNNPYLADITADPNLDAIIQKRKNDISALKAKGVQALGVRARFEKAGVPELYRSVYNRLCAASHNDSGELARRHLVHEKDGVSLVMFRQSKPVEYILLLETGCGMLIATAADLQKLPGIKGDFGMIEKLREELGAIRKRGDEIMGGH